MKLMLLAAASSVTGGAERHVADLLRGLPERGFELSLICPQGGDLTSVARQLHIPVTNFDIAESYRPGLNTALRMAILAERPDVVHAHGARAAMFARMADTRAKERCVYTVHGIHVDKAGSVLRQKAFTAVERYLKRKTNHFVTVCAADIGKGERLGVLDPARATVVYNGIEAHGPQEPTGAFRAELGIDAVTPLALSVGRFHEQKDQRTLLDAWAHVRERHPEAVLALVGGGALEGALREHAISLGLGRSIRFVAPRPRLETAYADADVFVLSSLWEGLPYVILEAMDAGLPVVSTDVDGIPEAVDDGVTGLLVPSKDPSRLTESLCEVLGDRQRASAMGAAGAEKVAAKFDLDTMLDSLANVYREVAG